MVRKRKNLGLEMIEMGWWDFLEARETVKADRWTKTDNARVFGRSRPKNNVKSVL